MGSGLACPGEERRAPQSQRTVHIFVTFPQGSRDSSRPSSGTQAQRLRWAGGQGVHEIQSLSRDRRQSLSSSDLPVCSHPCPSSPTQSCPEKGSSSGFGGDNGIGDSTQNLPTSGKHCITKLQPAPPLFILIQGLAKLLYCPGWAQICNLPASAALVTGITGMNHGTQPHLCFMPSPRQCV